MCAFLVYHSLLSKLRRKIKEDRVSFVPDNSEQIVIKSCCSILHASQVILKLRFLTTQKCMFPRCEQNLIFVDNVWSWKRVAFLLLLLNQPNIKNRKHHLLNLSDYIGLPFFIKILKGAGTSFWYSK